MKPDLVNYTNHLVVLEFTSISQSGVSVALMVSLELSGNTTLNISQPITTSKGLKYFCDLSSLDIVVLSFF